MAYVGDVAEQTAPPPAEHLARSPFANVVATIDGELQAAKAQADAGDSTARVRLAEMEAERQVADELLESNIDSARSQAERDRVAFDQTACINGFSVGAALNLLEWQAGNLQEFARDRPDVVPRLQALRALIGRLQTRPDEIRSAGAPGSSVTAATEGSNSTIIEEQTHTSEAQMQATAAARYLVHEGVLLANGKFPASIVEANIQDEPIISGSEVTIGGHYIGRKLTPAQSRNLLTNMPNLLEQARIPPSYSNTIVAIANYTPPATYGKLRLPLIEIDGNGQRIPTPVNIPHNWVICEWNIPIRPEDDATGRRGYTQLYAVFDPEKLANVTPFDPGNVHMQTELLKAMLGADVPLATTSPPTIHDLR